MNSVPRGVVGELLAAQYLREHGYAIWSANYRCRWGEIDIIAAKKPYIAFVEVKTRSEDFLYTPREAVTAAKQRRIIQTARLYLREADTDLQPRFDVLEIVTRSHQPAVVVSIEHITNAYDAEGWI